MRGVNIVIYILHLFAYNKMKSIRIGFLRDRLAIKKKGDHNRYGEGCSGCSHSTSPEYKTNRAEECKYYQKGTV